VSVDGPTQGAKEGFVSGDENRWRRCSNCKKPIAFGGDYWICNVSTCNRKSNAFVFCTVSCWDAHLGIVNHRESWAVDKKAPSRQAWEREQAEASATPARPAPAQRAARSHERGSRPAGRESRRIIASGSGARRSPAADVEQLPRDILIVASKLKAYIKARAGLSVSDRVLEPLSDAVRALTDEAIESAIEHERKTVLDRDFKKR
jgi:hypothetical protein